MITKAALDTASLKLAEFEGMYSEAEQRGDQFAMAKALDGSLRTQISVSDGEERQRLVTARAQLVMKTPEAAPSFQYRQSMAKSFVAVVEPEPEIDADLLAEQEALLAELDRPYVPPPCREVVQMSRDLSILNALALSEVRLAKCVQANDQLGAFNALEVQLSHKYALAKSEDSRQEIRQLRTQLYMAANEAGYEYSDRGIYGLAKASAADARNAKAFDKMYLDLTRALEQAPATMRRKIEELRTEVISMAQGMGIRLSQGQFVPYAS